MGAGRIKKQKKEFSIIPATNFSQRFTKTPTDDAPGGFGNTSTIAAVATSTIR
jgi:hypothetical protein